jgi:ABC-type uncharacterized transport system auxiliary subunit
MKILTISFILIFSFGCLGLQKAYPDKKTFSIELKPPEAMPKFTIKQSSKIRRVRMASNFQEKSLVYKNNQNQFEADYYNEFLIYPNQMIMEFSRKWLEESNIFQMVIDNGSRIDAQKNIEILVNEFYGDYTSNGPSAVVEAQIYVFDDENGKDKLYLKKKYRVVKKISSKDSASLVEGMSLAWEEILKNFKKDLISQK